LRPFSTTVADRISGTCRAAALAALALVTWTGRAEAANDPALVWHTIETPHFRINYYSGEQDVAEHIADLGEDINARLEPLLGWKSSERTEIVITDQTDGSNGSATAIPYNAITLYVTAPSDLSPLNDVDDWYQELVTHEYTHILHTDNIGGLPSVINAVLGKTYAPNQAQAKWILEGLAVFMESEHTSGGRLRSSQWNMWMRADVLEGNVAPLDVFSNTPRRWPEGNIYYVYGSFFMQWFIETYGEGALRRMVTEYGSTLVPYGVNRVVKHASGSTFEDMYPSFVDTLKREFTAQADAIRARGLREGTRVTFGGYTVEHPRWIPKNAWPDHAGDLLYFKDDANETPGFYAAPVTRDPGGSGRVTSVNAQKRELVIRSSGDGSVSFTPEGGVVASGTDVTDNLFSFDDLYAMPPGAKSPNGMEGVRTRLTNGFRAVDPDVSPDGRRVVFATNHRGTTYLEIADRSPQGLTGTRTLVPSGRFDQAYTPRWSPDNVHVAYSVWTRGGYRDVRLVDTHDGSWVDVTHDRALDQDPSFSADGKTLYFTSDRTGVMNVYAYDIATRGLMQVTNVINGAYYPEASPDGKTLAYVGYTTKGFDLFVMPLDPSTFLPALPYDDSYRGPPPPIPAHHAWPIRPYNPLPTLIPHAYTVNVENGDFGYQATVSASASDIASRHSVSASITSPFTQASFQPNLSYVYSALPVDLSFNVYRTVSPGVGYTLNSTGNQISFLLEQAGIQSGASYSLPRTFDTQSFSATYTFERTAANLAVPPSQLDPYAIPNKPNLGWVAIAHFGWSYSNAEQYLWSVSAEKGIDMAAGIDVSDGILGSEYRGFDATASFGFYQKMPWLQHHVLALHASAGTSAGGFPGQGLYYVGGFQDLNLIDTLRNQTTQGGVVLRGYPVVEEEGANFALFNAEYRFPILNVDRGASAYPIFLNRFYGAAFTDIGSAFDAPSTADFKIGSGAELRTDFTIGFIEAFTFRLGLAHGWSTDGINKLYFVSAAQF
jgi:Tol biopolymer transport system component